MLSIGHPSLCHDLIFFFASKLVLKHWFVMCVLEFEFRVLKLDLSNTALSLFHCQIHARLGKLYEI